MSKQLTKSSVFLLFVSVMQHMTRSMGLVMRTKTTVIFLVFAVCRGEDPRGTPRSQSVEVRNDLELGALAIVVDYSSLNNTIPPSHSSIDYTLECGVQNSATPFKKTTDSDDSGKIVGGSDAHIGEFPWQVSLQQSSKAGKQHICGGSIVSEDVIITAGHCVHGTAPSDLQIVAGAHNLFSSTGNEQIRAVKSILGRGYDQKNFKRDIALLLLQKPLKFDRFHVAPVCLPDSEFVYDGIDGVITGWGRLSEAGKLSPTLQVVSVPLLSTEKCRKSYENSGYGNNVGKCHICSGSEEGGVDSCRGDSGGPLTCVESDGRHYLCGIVSWGIGCARPNYPGVYTFTPCYSDWIAEAIKTHNSTVI